MLDPDSIGIRNTGKLVIFVGQHAFAQLFHLGGGGTSWNRMHYTVRGSFIVRLKGKALTERGEKGRSTVFIDADL
jgi:hypothetical protein